MPERLLHKALAAEIARYFPGHIEAELQKDRNLIDTVQFDGKTPQEINEAAREELLQEFPGIEKRPASPCNLF